MKCKNCGHENEDDKQYYFCSNCGVAIRTKDSIDKEISKEFDTLTESQQMALIKIDWKNYIYLNNPCKNVSKYMETNYSRFTKDVCGYFDEDEDEDEDEEFFNTLER